MATNSAANTTTNSAGGTTFPTRITISDAEIAVNTEFSINRKDFGIVYAGKTDDLIRDDIVIRLNLKSPRVK